MEDVAKNLYKSVVNTINHLQYSKIAIPTEEIITRPNYTQLCVSIFVSTWTTIYRRLSMACIYVKMACMYVKMASLRCVQNFVGIIKFIGEIFDSVMLSMGSTTTFKFIFRCILIYITLYIVDSQLFITINCNRDSNVWKTLDYQIQESTPNRVRPIDVIAYPNYMGFKDEHYENENTTIIRKRSNLPFQYYKIQRQGDNKTSPLHGVPMIVDVNGYMFSIWNASNYLSSLFYSNFNRTLRSNNAIIKIFKPAMTNDTTMDDIENYLIELDKQYEEIRYDYIKTSQLSEWEYQKNDFIRTAIIPDVQFTTSGTSGYIDSKFDECKSQINDADAFTYCKFYLDSDDNIGLKEIVVRNVASYIERSIYKITLTNVKSTNLNAMISKIPPNCIVQVTSSNSSNRKQANTSIDLINAKAHVFIIQVPDGTLSYNANNRNNAGGG